MIREITPSKPYRTRHEKFLYENEGKVIVPTNQWDSVSDWCYTFHDRRPIGISPKDMFEHLLHHLHLNAFAEEVNLRSLSLDELTDKNLIIIDGRSYKLLFLTDKEYEEKRKENKPINNIERRCDLKAGKEKMERLHFFNSMR